MQVPGENVDDCRLLSFQEFEEEHQRFWDSCRVDVNPERRVKSMSWAMKKIVPGPHQAHVDIIESASPDILIVTTSSDDDKRINFVMHLQANGIISNVIINSDDLVLAKEIHDALVAKYNQFIVDEWTVTRKFSPPKCLMDALTWLSADSVYGDSRVTKNQPLIEFRP